MEKAGEGLVEWGSAVDDRTKTEREQSNKTKTARYKDDEEGRGFI